MPTDFRAETYYDTQGVFSVDPRPRILRAGDADAEMRPACVALLKDYLRRESLVRQCRNLIDCRAARAALAAEGIVMDTAQFSAAYETHSTEADKVAADQVFAAQILALLEQGVKAHSDRVARAAITEIQVDLDTLTELDPLFERYGAPRSPLADALRRAIEQVRAEISRPLDLSWHYDKRVALSQMFFPSSAALELDPPAAPAPAAAAVPTAPGALRTAAEIAAAS